MKHLAVATLASAFLLSNGAHALPEVTEVAAPKRLIRDWNDASSLILSRSTDLHIALGDVLRAEAQSRTALAQSLPSLNGGVSGTLNILTNSGSQICQVNGQPQLCQIDVPIKSSGDASLSLSVPVVNLRAWYAAGTAREGVNVAKFAADDVKRTITLAVASAIVGVFTAERIAELNRIGLRNASARLDLAKQRVALGSGVALDVVRADQDVAASRATLITGDESLRQSREALGLALGLPEQVGVTNNFKLDGLEDAARKICKPVDKLEERADLQALAMRKTLADRAHKEAELSFLPTLTVTSQLATTTRDTGVFPRTTWDLRGVLSWSIWEGGARYGALRDTDAQSYQAMERFEAQRRRAQVEVTQATRAVSVTKESREVAGASRDLAEQTDRLTRLAFAEGRGTSLELITAATALRQAEITLALRDFELVRAKLASMLSASRCTY
jgi:outer membrane protein, multidrug efflux system